MSTEDGWTVSGLPGDRLLRGMVSFAGKDFTLLQDDKGKVLVYTAREWAAFLDGVHNGEFDDQAGLAALPVEGSRA